MKKNKSSEKLFEKAKNVIPGGVNSPVRAFQSVGGNPLFIKSAKGAYLYDEDGNAFIDLINSWGPMILGHGHPEILKAVNEAIKNGLSFGAPTEKEVKMAELIVSMVPSIESVRMVNSGTEATMSAIRLARGYTNKSKIIKFEGCYHGHGDSFLIAAGSGAITTGTPNSAGVTKGAAKDTLLVPFNNISKLEEVIQQNKNEIAALILEPVAGNMGCIPPSKDYLQQTRKLCDEHNIVLIFDEVMTGFRLASGGAQELYGVTPDLTTLGKIIGGGMPVGAYGGKKEIMNLVSPLGPVYQAGTLSGNPIAMSAGIAMLTQLHENDEIYISLEKNTQRITNAIQEEISKNDYPCSINQIGTMFTLFFSKEKCNNFDDAKKCDLELFSLFFQEMLSRGIYLPPSQFEAVFISTAIQNKEIEKIIEACKASLKVCFA